MPWRIPNRHERLSDLLSNSIATIGADQYAVITNSRPRPHGGPDDKENKWFPGMVPRGGGGGGGGSGGGGGGGGSGSGGGGSGGGGGGGSPPRNPQPPQNPQPPRPQQGPGSGRITGVLNPVHATDPTGQADDGATPPPGTVFGWTENGQRVIVRENEAANMIQPPPQQGGGGSSAPGDRRTPPPHSDVRVGGQPVFSTPPDPSTPYDMLAPPPNMVWGYRADGTRVGVPINDAPNLAPYGSQGPSRPNFTNPPQGSGEYDIGPPPMDGINPVPQPPVHRKDPPASGGGGSGGGGDSVFTPGKTNPPPQTFPSNEPGTVTTGPNGETIFTPSSTREGRPTQSEHLAQLGQPSGESAASNQDAPVFVPTVTNPYPGITASAMPAGTHIQGREPAPEGFYSPMTLNEQGHLVGGAGGGGFSNWGTGMPTPEEQQAHIASAQQRARQAQFEQDAMSAAQAVYQSEMTRYQQELAHSGYDSGSYQQEIEWAAQQAAQQAYDRHIQSNPNARSHQLVQSEVDRQREARIQSAAQDAGNRAAQQALHDAQSWGYTREQGYQYAQRIGQQAYDQELSRQNTPQGQASRAYDNLSARSPNVEALGRLHNRLTLDDQPPATRYSQSNRQLIANARNVAFTSNRS